MGTQVGSVHHFRKSSGSLAIFAALTSNLYRRASGMGFNRRKMEDQRRQAAEKEAATRRATDAQVLEDAERLIAAWNERQALRAPIIFSPTIGAAIRAGYWFLWVRCPACRTINAIDLRTLDRHPDAAVTSNSRTVLPLMPAERSVRGARAAVADQHRRRNARGASPASAWRVKAAPATALPDRPGRREAAFSYLRLSAPSWAA
jgi:hypothetical protein